MRRIPFALALVVASACSSVQQKIFESENRRLTTSIEITTDDAPQAATSKVLEAFTDHQLAVTSSQGGVVESKLPRELGLMGSYDIVVRAVIIPGTQATRISLYGEEVDLGNADDTETQLGGRLNAGSRGRALATWQKMLRVAAQVQPDSTRRVVRTQ